jgi:hypothetical protein
VATPATAATVVVPLIVAPNAFALSVSEMLVVAVVTTLPAASSIETLTGDSVPPLGEEGCVVNTSCDAAPAVTTNVAVTVCGLFVIPETAEVIATVAVYVPGLSPPTEGVSVSVVGAVVPAAVAVSQPLVCPAPYTIAPTVMPLSVPVPPLVIAIFCAAGLAAPTAPEKFAALVDNVIAGADGVGVVPPLSPPPPLPQERAENAANARSIRRMTIPVEDRFFP